MLIMTTTLTATSMSTAEQRLRLMQLASSNLPVGGYSWSQGLEWAVEAGWVPDVAAFERWQRRQMTEGFFTVDLPLFARLYRACEQGDIAAAQRWTAYLLACRETRELREEERNRGAAFARLLSDWQPDCPPPWRSLCQQSQLAGMAWLGVRWRIALPEMALSLGYSWIESAVMAGVKDLRAIPWVFSWSQNRYLFTGWYGLGHGLHAAMADFGADTLSALARDWLFFGNLLDDAEMVLIKADLGIAERYAQLVPTSASHLTGRIRAAYDDTVAAVFRLKGTRVLLEQDRILQRSIRTRNPYLDPVSLLQVELLARWRAGDRQDDALFRALVITVNAISLGLQNTG